MKYFIEYLVNLEGLSTEQIDIGRQYQTEMARRDLAKEISKVAKCRTYYRVNEAIFDSKSDAKRYSKMYGGAVLEVGRLSIETVE